MSVKERLEQVIRIQEDLGAEKEVKENKVLLSLIEAVERYAGNDGLVEWAAVMDALEAVTQ